MMPSPFFIPRLFTVVVLLAFASSPAWAQPESGRPSAEFAARGRFIAGSDLGAGGASVSQSSVGLAAEVPFPVTGNINGKLGASFDSFELEFENFDRVMPGTPSPLSRGRIVTLGASVSSRLSDQLIVFAGPQWELSGASGASAGSSVQWSGTAGVLWRWRPDFTLVGGVVVSERLGYSTRILPIAGFSWRIDDTWNLALTGNAADYQAPVLKLGRTLTGTTQLFAQVGFENAQVRLAADSSIPHGYLRYKAVVPQVGVDWKVTPGIALSVFTGVQLRQRYDFKDRAAQDVLRVAADGAWVGGLRLTGRF